MRRRRRGNAGKSGWPFDPIATVLGALAIALLLAGCSEKPQDPAQRTAGTTVTRDTRPWEAQATRFSAPGRASGDKAAYDQALRQRAQQQNEYVRIGN